MTAKENIQEHLRRICGEKSQKEEEESLKLLLLGTQLASYFFLSAVLARGIIFGVASPFGVAMLGASGAGLAGLSCLLGAGFGYLTLQGFSQGLRYLSACILCFALSFCFYDLKALKQPWILALITGLISGVTGFFYLSHGGWTSSEAMFYLAELIVTVVTCWSFGICFQPHQALKTDRLTQRIAGTVLACVLLISLSRIMLWGDISLGRTVAVVVLLGFSWREGAGVGTILGLCTGISLDLAQLALPLYGMTWGFAGLCAGFFREKSRLHSALAFLLASGTTVLWSLEDPSALGILYEVFFGSILFCAVPLTWLDYCHLSEDMAEGSTIETQDLARVRKQLEDTAKVFRLLGETLKTAFRPPENQNDVSVIFHRTAQKVCQRCYLCHNCWEKEYVATFNSMNDATPKILARGKSVPEDFPLYFAHKCLHFPEFIEEVNLQLTGLLYRRQYNNRVRESRVAVCDQYGQLSQLLEQASLQISQELSPQVKKARKISNYLCYLGIDAKVVLVENQQGMLQGEIVGQGTECLETHQGVAELSEMLEVPIRLRRTADTLLLNQLEPFMALAGYASSKKEGERVSGDQSSYFKREDGKLFMLVCDGMGSGEQARGESSLASELLEQFLKAGVDSLQALHILSSALALRGEDGAGFTTVDLLELNLITAQGILYKLGAAPTYFRRGDEIRRIVGKSLPAGADFGQQVQPDQIKLTLEPEDCLLLVSDGVSGASEEDQWLCEMFQNFDGESMKEFSRQVIAKTPEGGKDDRTAVVVKIALRDTEDAHST